MSAVVPSASLPLGHILTPQSRSRAGPPVMWLWNGQQGKVGATWDLPAFPEFPLNHTFSSPLGK